MTNGVKIKISGVRENPDGKMGSEKNWMSERMLIQNGGQNENLVCQRQC